MRYNWAEVSDLDHIQAEFYWLTGIAAIPRKQVQLELMQEEQRKNDAVGVTSWISMGMKIQEEK